MKLLVFVHHDDGEFSPQALGVLAKAASLGAEVQAFVAGSGVDDSWAASLGGHGAGQVLVADDAALESGLSQPLVDALEPSAREADGVLFGAGVVSADVAAGLAARLGAGIACETTQIAVEGDELVATRPALGDTVMVSSGFASGPWRRAGTGQCVRRRGGCVRNGARGAGGGGRGGVVAAREAGGP